MVLLNTIGILEESYRKKENWEKSVPYCLEFLSVIEKANDILSDEYLSRKYWMLKNTVVAYFGLKEYKNAEKYQKKLYTAYKSKELPDGIDAYYNFEKFIFNDLNIWGYEWYPELGDPETKRSFSKHTYYVYSTDKNGNDKDQLYTLQTVKIHKFKGDEPD